jgi:hypothetical protein
VFIFSTEELLYCEYSKVYYEARRVMDKATGVFAGLNMAHNACDIFDKPTADLLVGRSERAR